jgi:hypothetical protein
MVATPKILTNTVSSCTGLKSIRVTESYNAALAQTQIACYDTTLNLGDAINFDIGYVGDSGKAFQGYVKHIEKNLPDLTTTVVCEDELTKAVDYYMASDTPDNPFSRSDILTEDLVRDILAEAQISSFTSSIPLVVYWGTHGTRVEFNLTNAWQAAKSIVDALAWHLYCDRNGLVHLTDDHPYKEIGEIITPDFTWTDATHNLIALTSSISAEELRNRVVVYGINNLSATASASSPYLPPGFYKTAVVATPIITNTGQAQQVADLNLARFNRLTESLNIVVEGDYEITPRKWANITNTYLGISGDWFIYQVEHTFDDSGYKCNVMVTR